MEKTNKERGLEAMKRVWDTQFSNNGGTVEISDIHWEASDEPGVIGKICCVLLIKNGPVVPARFFWITDHESDLDLGAFISASYSNTLQHVVHKLGWTMHSGNLKERLSAPTMGQA